MRDDERSKPERAIIFPHNSKKLLPTPDSNHMWSYVIISTCGRSPLNLHNHTHTHTHTHTRIILSDNRIFEEQSADILEIIRSFGYNIGTETVRMMDGSDTQTFYIYIWSQVFANTQPLAEKCWEMCYCSQTLPKLSRGHIYCYCSLFASFR